MRIASVQLAASERSKEEQIRRATRLIEPLEDVDLLLLPELWTTGAFCYERMEAEAEAFDGPTLHAMQEIARRKNCHFYAGSWVEESDAGLHNTAAFLAPSGEVLEYYHKIHPFGYQSREAELMTPGQTPKLVSTPLATFGLATCYDLRFPELFRSLSDVGAECFLVCSGWPHQRLEHWQLFNRVRALENQCYLISCNSCGKQDGLLYAGHSMVVDPWGIPQASAGDLETVMTADIELSLVAEARSTFPVLEDRVLKAGA